jgi:hypothetical protein
LIVKTPAFRPPAAAHAVATMRHEYELLHQLDLPGVVKVLQLVQTSGGLALLMRDVGAVNLSQ